MPIVPLSKELYQFYLVMHDIEGMTSRNSKKQNGFIVVAVEGEREGPKKKI